MFLCIRTAFECANSFGSSQEDSFGLFPQQFCHRLSLIGFAQSKNGCTLAVPPNTVPNPVFIAIHDFERGDRALVPVLNFAQDSINILGHGELAEGGIGDRYRARRNLVDEIGPGRGLHGYVELKAISFLICRYQVPNSREAQAARAPLGARHRALAKTAAPAPETFTQRLKAEQGQERKGHATTGILLHIYHYSVEVDLAPHEMPIISWPSDCRHLCPFAN